MGDYLNIRIGAPRRLAVLKRAAEKLNANPHRALPEKVYTWRDVRYSGYHNARENRCELSPGMDGKKPIWYCHTGPAFPRERFADECESVHSIDHSGWFSNEDATETIRGLVVALPHGRFLAGYYMSMNGERVYYADLFDDERTAAYAADSIAQRLAEDERAYNVRWNEARDLENEASDNMQRLRECLALRNKPCFARLRDEARRLVERIREIRESLKTEYADVL